MPPGRKYHDRDNLRPVEEEIELGPPTLDNDGLYRQQFAIQDYLQTLRTAITHRDVNAKVGAQAALKPAIKNAFYIEEQRWASTNFVEPEDEAMKDKETGKHVVDYMTLYKENPHFIDKIDND